MKKLLENFEEWVDYFLYYPDKTNVIFQVNILNPLYKFIENLIHFIFKIVRIFIFQLIFLRQKLFSVFKNVK